MTTKFTLYEITDELLALYEEWEIANEVFENADDDTKLIAEATVASIEARLADFGDALATKAEGYAKLIRNLEAESYVLRAKAAPFLEEAQRYLGREKAVSSKVDRLKGWLLLNLRTAGVEKITGLDLSVRRQKNSVPTIETLDIDAVPLEFLIPLPPKVDTTAVRAAWKKTLQAEDAVPGLRIERREHIRIS